MAHGWGQSEEGKERRRNSGLYKYHRWLELAYKANGLKYESEDAQNDAKEEAPAE